MAKNFHLLLVILMLASGGLSCLKNKREVALDLCKIDYCFPGNLYFEGDCSVQVKEPEKFYFQSFPLQDKNRLLICRNNNSFYAVKFQNGDSVSSILLKDFLRCADFKNDTLFYINTDFQIQSFNILTGESNRYNTFYMAKRVFAHPSDGFIYSAYNSDGGSYKNYLYWYHSSSKQDSICTIDAYACAGLLNDSLALLYNAYSINTINLNHPEVLFLYQHQPYNLISPFGIWTQPNSNRVVFFEKNQLKLFRTDLNRSYTIGTYCLANEARHVAFKSNTVEILYKEMKLTDASNAKYQFYINEFDNEGKLIGNHIQKLSSE
ncbi:MAG: hypothetical protein GC180_12125 [Bacteroidetes bacterium]|nr:hypothetical protein [Bacteroidota bacterium]